MTPASPFRAVYKTVEGQDIDVDVYLPDPAAGAPEARSPICMPAFPAPAPAPEKKGERC